MVMDGGGTMKRNAVKLALAWTAVLGVSAAAAEMTSTDELVPFETFIEERAPEQSEPMIERSAYKPRLATLPNVMPLVKWEKHDGIGLRRVRWAPEPAQGTTRADVDPRAAAPINALWAAAGTRAGIAAIQESRSKDPSNTNLVQAFCSALKCTPGAKAGETVIETPDGRKLTHTYDQALPLGKRNTITGQDQDGKAFEYSASPLVFDLGRKGVRVSDRRLRYDIDGDGYREAISDFSSGNGVLAFDSDHDGVSGGSGRELFGENTDLDGDGRRDGFKDGFEALQGLIRRGVSAGVLAQRVIDEKLLGPADLAALEKAYGLKMRVGGLQKKAVSLREAGVKSLALSDEPSRLVRDFDGQGNDVMHQDGAVFTRADGSQGTYSDVWFSFSRNPGGHLVALNGK